ncbi:ankyrin repeat-containing protein BDA1-like [Ziziphus jujuba]|uniref:Ankyrin repeat-containing protein BDA1-like n=1 Tax=Ziziphus jujuba TaxID=326968 RepID=A0ABM3I8C3_ZIZJJ|nr:ankyrin repeat-containing protein BDA1-like [Ziziphus jujuba]
MGDLILKEGDEMGCTPLHHAAKMGCLPAVKLFMKLTNGREAAYMKDKKGNTALHLAAASNHKDTMAEIMKRCPECSELVNKKGWNILHCAVQNDDPQFRQAMDTILKKNAFSNLLNEKDEQGNTPLHHIAISLNKHRLHDLIHHPRVDKMAFNKDNHNALDLASATKTFAVRKVS